MKSNTLKMVLFAAAFALMTSVVYAQDGGGNGNGNGNGSTCPNNGAKKYGPEEKKFGVTDCHWKDWHGAPHTTSCPSHTIEIPIHYECETKKGMKCTTNTPKKTKRQEYQCIAKPRTSRGQAGCQKNGAPTDSDEVNNWAEKTCAECEGEEPPDEEPPKEVKNLLDLIVE